LADLVEISNVGENGVASEATLSALVRQMEDFARRSGMDPKSAAGRAQKMYNDAQDKGVKIIKDETSSRKQQLEATNEATAALSNLSSRMSSMAVGVIGSLVGGLVNLGAEVLNGGNRLSDFAQHIPLAGNVLGGFFGMLDQNLDVLRQVSGVGAAFDNSIRTLRQAANDTLMMPDEFARTIAQNTDAIMYMGTTMTDGAQRFSRVSRDLQESGGFEQLMNLGYTVEEINDGLLSYTRTQALRGRLQEMTDRQLREGTREYLENLDAVSKLTGLQRDELERAQATEALNAQSRFFAREIEQAGGNVENFNSGLAAIDRLLGPTWATGFRDALDGTMQQSEEGRALLAVTGPEILRVAQEFRRTQDITTLFDNLQRLGVQAEETGMGLGGVLLGSLQDDVMGSVFNEATRAAALNIGDMNDALGEQGQRGGVTSQLITFEENMRRVQQAITDTFLSQELALLPDLLGRINNYIDIDNPEGLIGTFRSSFAAVTEYFDQFMADADEQGLFPTIMDRVTSAFETIWESVKNIWTNNETVQEIKTAIMEFVNGLGITDTIRGIVDTVREFFTGPQSGGGESFFGRMIDDLADRFLNGEAMGEFLQNLSMTLEATGLRLLENLPFGLFNSDMAARLAELEGLGFSSGTQGFMNFGSGTMAALHGREAVIPYNSPAGQLLRDSGYGSNGNQVDRSSTTSYNNSQAQTQMVALLERAVSELRESNRQHEQEIRALRSMTRDVTVGSPY
jgi:hypothetical protein